MKSKSIKIRMIKYFSVLILIIFVFFIVFALIQIQHTAKDLSYQNCKNLTKLYANNFEEAFQSNFNYLKGVSNILESEAGKSRADIIKLNKYIVEQNKAFQGIYIIYEKNALDGKDEDYKGNSEMMTDNWGRFCPWFYYKDGAVVSSVSDDVTGSAYDSLDYYTGPRESLKEYLADPYEDPDIHILMASIVQPILVNGEFKGIVGGDITLDFIHKIVRELKVFKTGYAFVLSKNGTFVSYPQKEFIGKKTLGAFADSLKNEELKKLSEELLQGKEGFIEAKDPITKKKSVFFYTPFSKGWSIVVVAPKMEIFAPVYNLTWILILITILAMMLFIYFTKKLADRLLKPILQVNLMLKEIAEGEGDLTKRIVTETNDEIGEMANYFNIFVENIQIIMQKISLVSNNIIQKSSILTKSSSVINNNSFNIARELDTVSVATEEVSASSMTISAAIEESSASINHLSTKTEMMKTQINNTTSIVSVTAQSSNDAMQDLNKVAGNLDKMYDGIEKLTFESKNTAKSVNEMSTSLSGIAVNTQNTHNISLDAKEKAHNTKMTISELQSSAEQIGNIITMITKIASQTNLLALNATIEAASAGDAGKGFAVVATEVKELAKQTADAAGKISKEIDIIRSKVNTSVRSIEKIVEVNDSMYEITTQVTKNIQEQSQTTSALSASINKVSDYAVQIESNIGDVNKQNKNVCKTIDNIVGNVNNINNISQENLKLSMDISRDSEENTVSVNEIANNTSQINVAINALAENLSSILNETKMSAEEASVLSGLSLEFQEEVDNLVQMVRKFKV